MSAPYQANCGQLVFFTETRPGEPPPPLSLVGVTVSTLVTIIVSMVAACQQLPPARAWRVFTCLTCATILGEALAPDIGTCMSLIGNFFELIDSLAYVYLVRSMAALYRGGQGQSTSMQEM